MFIELTTLGSRGTTIKLAPSALRESGPGGIQVTISVPLWQRPTTIYQLTHDQAVALGEELKSVLAETHVGEPARP